MLGFPVLPRVTDRTPSLRWAHHTQAGVSNLLRSDLWTASVPPDLEPGSRGRDRYRRVRPGWRLLLCSRFRSRYPAPERRRALNRDGYHMESLAGSTLGVVGLGGIGQEVARLARALGMRVIGTRRSVDKSPRPSGWGRPGPARLAAVRTGGPERLRGHLLSAHSLRRGGCSTRTSSPPLKPGSVLINVARGEEIVEAAMIDAIRSGRLRGALLDVYDGESLGQAPRPELLQTSRDHLDAPHFDLRGPGGRRTGEAPFRRQLASVSRRRAPAKSGRSRSRLTQVDSSRRGGMIDDSLVRS